MRAAVIERIGSFEIREVQRPRPGPQEALVKVAVAGLCRTDLKIVEAGHRDLVLPRIPAEEVVGTVCELGPNTDKRLLGKRVYVYPGTSCGECGPCRSGAENLCSRMRIMGFHRDGGFAEYVATPVRSLIELPERLAFEHAVFAEPMSCCLNALELAHLRPDEKIFVWGAGPAGTLLVRLSEAMGATAVAFEPDDRRRSLLKTREPAAGETADVAVVAVGDRAAYVQAMERLGPRGRLVVFSGLVPDRSVLQVDFNRLHYMEQTVVGAYGCSYRHGEQALDWIARGEISVLDMISHRLSLEELGRGLDLVRKREGMKILLYPSVDC